MRRHWPNDKHYETLLAGLVARQVHDNKAI